MLISQGISNSTLIIVNEKSYLPSLARVIYIFSMHIGYMQLCFEMRSTNPINVYGFPSFIKSNFDVELAWMTTPLGGNFNET